MPSPATLLRRFFFEFLHICFTSFQRPTRQCKTLYGLTEAFSARLHDDQGPLVRTLIPVRTPTAVCFPDFFCVVILATVGVCFSFSAECRLMIRGVSLNGFVPSFLGFTSPFLHFPVVTLGADLSLVSSASPPVRMCLQLVQGRLSFNSEGCAPVSLNISLQLFCAQRCKYQNPASSTPQ